MILNAKFNLDSFSNWIEEFLPNFGLDVRKVEVPNGFWDAKSIATLGESNLGVRVFVIETIKDPSERKVGLAKDSFNLIKNYGTPNALIAYYSENTENWRFSLLTSTPSWSEGKIITKLSNPKRHSYVLGPNAKVNTPSRFLINKGKILDFNDLKSRFSLEVVNKEFYKEISESYIKLVGGTRGEGKNKETYNAILKLPSIAEHGPSSIEFAVRLIGRIIFCWFLREKKSDSGSSLMPKELLSFNAIQSNPDYYHNVLEPIFFEVLNQPMNSRRDPFYERPYSLIPYLNGGLFSPQDDDFYRRRTGELQSQFYNTLILPDTWLKEFFTILETYNFTIDENTSIDEDLSIDPEMLGRIFENLLAEINPETGESARKSTGSYYTPRVIVDYMVDESLLLYLKQKTNIQENKLRAIISYDLSDDASYPLNESEKEVVIDAIEKVKILDPACGSGAFPIGALQKIVFILQQTDPEGQIWFHKQIQNTSPEIRRVMEREFSHRNFDYIRKLGIIRENIYGIDIQPIATEISRLRCFLTLVVDERIDDSQENRGIEPLPNLDFKFVTANSLIGLPTSNKQNQIGLFEDTEGINELREIRDMFFNASGSEREQLKLQFVQIQNKMFQRLISENRRGHAELTTMLTTWDPFGHEASSWFDPEWMFGIKDGFDLVIANPPYISFGLRGTQKMTSEERKVLVSLYPNSAEYKISFYALFMDKAIQLSKLNGGIQTYIVPDSFLVGRYFSKIRANVLNNCEIAQISWLPHKIFDAVIGYSVVYTFTRKKDIDDNHILCARWIQDGDQIPSRSYKEFSFPQSYYKAQKYNRFRLFFNQQTMDLVKKIEGNSSALDKYLVGRTGVRSLIGQKNIVSKEAKAETWQKGLISSAQVTKYSIVYDGDYINIDPEILNKGGWDYDVIHNPKILVRQTADNLTAAIDNKGYYHLNNLHSFALIKSDSQIKLQYVLALINSRLLNWFYQTISLETGRTMAQTDIETLECLPIFSSDSDKQRQLINLVENIMSLTSDKNYSQDLKKQTQVKEYEKQIDQMVYDIYGLTEEEIKIVEG